MAFHNFKYMFYGVHCNVHLYMCAKNAYMLMRCKSKSRFQISINVQIEFIIVYMCWGMSAIRMYLRNKISFFELHWDMNCSLSHDQIPKGVKVDLITYQLHVHIPMQMKKMIFYFLYLHLYLFMILLGFHNF